MDVNVRSKPVQALPISDEELLFPRLSPDEHTLVVLILDVVPVILVKIVNWSWFEARPYSVFPFPRSR
jgi:hypothetical protein